MKDFDTIELIKQKAIIYDTYVTGVAEMKLARKSPAGMYLRNWKFNSEADYKSYRLLKNFLSKKPYTCLISVKTVFSNN